MEIVLVRHGETDWSLNGRHTSRTDLPLIDTGRERAQLLGSMLADRSFALVLCSPMLRARETCELAGFESVAVLAEDLREWDYGSYEGLTTPEIRGLVPEWNLWRDGCPGGETPDAVAARADRALVRLRRAEGDSLVFAHGHILRVVAARWLGMDVGVAARFAFGAGAIGVLGFERETEVLARWNF